MGDWIMSPQARRRLVRTMTEGELRDLAAEIVRDLRIDRFLTLGEPEVNTIIKTLTRSE